MVAPRRWFVKLAVQLLGMGHQDGMSGVGDASVSPRPVFGHPRKIALHSLGAIGVAAPDEGEYEVGVPVGNLVSGGRSARWTKGCGLLGGETGVKVIHFRQAGDRSVAWAVRLAWLDRRRPCPAWEGVRVRDAPDQAGGDLPGVRPCPGAEGARGEPRAQLQG